VAERSLIPVPVPVEARVVVVPVDDGSR